MFGVRQNATTHAWVVEQIPPGLRRRGDLLELPRDIVLAADQYQGLPAKAAQSFPRLLRKRQPRHVLVSRSAGRWRELSTLEIRAQDLNERDDGGAWVELAG